MAFSFGWVKRPAEVEADVAQMPIPELRGNVLAPLQANDLGNDVFAWDFAEKVLGRQLKSVNQRSVGSCVGCAGAHAAQDVIIVQCAIDGVQWPGAEVCAEGVYGMSRCEYGNFCGRGDGSFGAAAARAVTQGGLLLYKKYAEMDLSGGYSESRARQWGAGRGVPDNLEPYARQYLIKVTTRVNTAEAAWAAIGSGYFINICGDISRTERRDKFGICRRIGMNWAHAQELCGRCTIKDGRRCFVYRNSWGDYLTSLNNTVELASGRVITLPVGCYLAEITDVEVDLRQNDSFAYSAISGLEPRQLTWRNW